MNDQHRTRRGLLVAAAGGGAALAIASCGGDSKPKRDVETVSTTQAQSDAAILGALLDLEHSSIAAYGYVAAKLRGRPLAAARTFAAQERRHAAAIEAAIRKVGGSPAAARPAREYVDGFPSLRGEREALSFALDVETTAIAAYADALGKFATDAVRSTAAAILVTESEHAAVVLGGLRRPQVPEPFVTGPPPSEDSR